MSRAELEKRIWKSVHERQRSKGERTGGEGRGVKVGVWAPNSAPSNIKCFQTMMSVSRKSALRVTGISSSHCGCGGADGEVRWDCSMWHLELTDFRCQGFQGTHSSISSVSVVNVYIPVTFTSNAGEHLSDVLRWNTANVWEGLRYVHLCVCIVYVHFIFPSSKQTNTER